MPLEPDAESANRLRDRLAAQGAVAVLAQDADGPVACCFATPLWKQDAARRGAHLSGVAMSPERWGREFEAGIVNFMEQMPRQLVSRSDQVRGGRARRTQHHLEGEP
jgi:hypothetical protein